MRRIDVERDRNEDNIPIYLEIETVTGRNRQRQIFR